MSQVSRGPMPPHLKAIWEKSIASIDPKEIDANFEKSRLAAAEDSFSGFVRRCVRRRAMPWSRIADDAQIELQRFALFMRGDGSLDTSEVDRLLAAIGVEVVGA
jgi:hypothetical protein